jgi:hypothetical protein
MQRGGRLLVYATSDGESLAFLVTLQRPGQFRTFLTIDVAEIEVPFSQLLLDLPDRLVSSQRVGSGDQQDEEADEDTIHRTFAIVWNL